MSVRNIAFLIIMQIRREFRALLDLEQQISSLKEEWLSWREKLVKLARAARPALKKLVGELDIPNSETNDGKFIVHLTHLDLLC